MTSPKTIHHINFIVADLDESVRAYQELLALPAFEFETLPSRGVRTARVNIGGVWLVLVCPEDEACAPGRFLAENGEGFFLLSFGVDDLDAALSAYERQGHTGSGSKPRKGLMNWRVADLDTQDRLGALFHLTELASHEKNSQ